MFFLHLETKMACRWVVLLVTGVVEMWICSTEVKSDSSPKMAVPLSINKFPHILRCHNNLRICELKPWSSCQQQQKSKRLVDEKAPPSRRDGIVTMKALTGDVHHAISHFCKKRFPVWHGWPGRCRTQQKKGVALEVNGACVSWKSRHFCIASCEASQISCFICYYCPTSAAVFATYISLNVHMSAQWQVCKYGSGTGT